MLILRTPRRKKVSKAEQLLARQITHAGLPEPLREYQFHRTRKWRFDFVWLDVAVAVEVEGGTFASGRHTRGSGFEDDAEKYNSAVVLGWRVLRFTPRQIKNGDALSTITTILLAPPEGAPR